MSFATRLLALLALCCFGTIGCNSAPSDMPKLAQVSGTVTLDGQPAGNLVVNFESANGQVAFGNTDASGRYELSFANGAKGAEIGSNVVRITTVLDAPTPPGYKDPVPAKYNVKSELNVEVKAGENTHDFPLVTK